MSTNQCPWPDSGQILRHQCGIFVTQLSQERQLYSKAVKFQAFCWPYFKLFKNTNISIKLNFFFVNSDDFGKKFRPINAEIFNTHIRKTGGIMKSPVNPKKVCCWGLRNSAVYYCCSTRSSGKSGVLCFLKNKWKWESSKIETILTWNSFWTTTYLGYSRIYGWSCSW